MLSFEFVSIESYMVDLLKEDAINTNLGVLYYQSGYESIFVIVNLSRSIAAILVIMVFGFVARCLDKNRECQLRDCKPNGRTFVHNYTWNDIVRNVGMRIIICSYLTISVSIFINFRAVSRMRIGRIARR